MKGTDTDKENIEKEDDDEDDYKAEFTVIDYRNNIFIKNKTKKIEINLIY